MFGSSAEYPFLVLKWWKVRCEFHYCLRLLLLYWLQNLKQTKQHNFPSNSPKKPTVVSLIRSLCFTDFLLYKSMPKTTASLFKISSNIFKTTFCTFEKLCISKHAVPQLFRLMKSSTSNMFYTLYSGSDVFFPSGKMFLKKR